MSKQNASKKTSRSARNKGGQVRRHHSGNHPGQDPIAVARKAFKPTVQDLHNMEDKLRAALGAKQAKAGWDLPFSPEQVVIPMPLTPTEEYERRINGR